MPGTKQWLSWCSFLLLASLLIVKNRCLVQVSILLGDEKHQPSGEVLVKTHDFLPPLYAKRQRHVWFQQRALDGTTGRWKWLHFHSSSLSSFIWHWQQSFKHLLLACPDSLPWPLLDTHPCQLSGKAWLWVDPIRTCGLTHRMKVPGLPLCCGSAILAELFPPDLLFSPPTPKKYYQPTIVMWKWLPGNGF